MLKLTTDKNVIKALTCPDCKHANDPVSKDNVEKAKSEIKVLFRERKDLILALENAISEYKGLVKSDYEGTDDYRSMLVNMKPLEEILERAKKR